MASLREVVVTITGIELTHDDGERTSITQFYDPDTGENTAEQFTVNLLAYQGAATADLLREVMVAPDTYTKLTLHIADESFATSYVVTDAGEQKLLKVPSDKLQLDGFTLLGDQRDSTWVIEFDLRKAMTYNPSPDRYILKPRGLRVLEKNASATVTGTVDLNFFNAQTTCGDNSVVYLYDATEFSGLSIRDTQGELVTNTFTLSTEQANLVQASITDQFDPDVETSAPEGAVRPFTSVDTGATGDYTLAYLPSGGYVMVYSCSAAGDDADRYDALNLSDFPDHFTYLYLGVDDAGDGEQEQFNLPVL